MGIKNFPLQTIGQVIRNANVAAPVTVDPSSMSVPTPLHGHEHGRQPVDSYALVSSS